jgi:hypothetical protein
VGREAELAELVAALDDAIAGHGRLFLLVGEPGIGKSRLAEELAGTARSRGARVLVGRCWEAGGAPAYWPWVQSLRAYARETDPAVLRTQLGTRAVDLAQLLPELRELFPDLGDPPSLEPESARFRLFDAVTDFLARVSRTQPLVLVLDDLHAADEPSLLLLRFLARELDGRRVLVIGAYRDVDPTPRRPLTATIAELGREPVTRSLAMPGLEPGDVRRFIQLVSGEEPSEELVATIHGDTEGNPLFVGEIVRLLATEGRLDDAPVGRPSIPQSVRDAIARRLEHLSAECNRVLVLASILGREFDPGVLAGIADLGEEGLLDTLDEAMEARVVSDVPGTRGRFRFAHVLIRDTLYEGLSTARRVRLHRRVVVALEEAPGSSDAELAYHSIAGSDFDKGLLYARRAADRALELLAYEEAARLYTMALDALELAADDPAERCRVLLSLGEAEIRAGHGPAGRQGFLEAADLARRLGLARELALAAVGYGGRILWVRAGGDDRLVPLLEEALSVLPEDEVELRARLLARLAGAIRDEHDRDRRDRLSREAVALARETGSPTTLGFALAARAHAIEAPDTIEECLALGDELASIAAQNGDRERLVAGHSIRILSQLVLGDIAAAEEQLAASGRLADELRQPAQLWDVRGEQALFALARGKLDEAEQLTEEALALGEHTLPEAAIPIHHMQRYALDLLRGDVADSEAAIRRLTELYPQRTIFRCALAHLQAVAGRIDEAGRALAELSRDDFAAVPFDQEWLCAMCFLAETAWLAGDRESAGSLYRALLPWAGLNAVDVAEAFMGSVSRYLGRLAEVLDRPDDAVRHFEEAIAFNERMEARPWVAYGQQDCARLIARREPERAAELLAEARATYRELGMREPDAAIRARAGR